MEYVPSLSTLRFFGASSVIFLHLGSYQFFVRHGWEQWHVLVSGNSGVVLFFVLSGFLLTNIALKEIEVKGRFSVRNFFWRRGLRLLPLYFVSLGVLLLVQYLGFLSIPLPSYLYAFTYTYNMVPRQEYSGHLGPYHTLAIEEQFYIIFAILFASFGNAKWPQHRMWITIIFLVGLIVTFIIRPLFNFWEADYFVERWTMFAMAPIIIGALGAIFYKSKFVGQILTPDINKTSNNIRSKLSVSLLFMFVVIYFSQVFFVNTLIMSISFLCLIFALSINPNSSLSKFLSWKIFVYLGTISYGIYIWGAVFIGTGTPYLIPNPFVASLAILGASVMSFRFLEKPFLNLKSRGFGAKNK